ncbi:type VI secretion system baseplate subunit TssE [Janthinobacterium fluminis]|uniref:Type VI secretion system baseplate subunit TssE n=1 Tax=Janthinobacterium fluminis TaxID=2987524 RepID=A0ABT5JVL9_9BURK|nr:type VI secretion system baseplate subunit TssE [Janthinobacterium fluminis]MDC8756679.1 type VI secretion system baseplate subunit TssE [Janthinobacterium fluminis]
MSKYLPSLFDRLIDDRCYAGADGLLARLSLEQLKDAVARDLEALLNTRTVLPEAMLAEYPDAASSMLDYGLIDFSGFCLSSDADRKTVCAHLRAAIERHEPRLRDVRARLELNAGASKRLQFVISATLRLASVSEAVNFSAVLQPATLQYSISQCRRG